MIALRCSALSKYFFQANRHTKALDGVAFEAGQGEFITIVGRSGCGKSTLLRLISGIDTPTSGVVEFPSNQHPKIGMVFQNNAVFPWRTVEGNLSFALEAAGLPSATRKREAVRIATLLGLEPAQYLTRYPRELSGGETRRVAIGMTLAGGANILLLDEPTSQLDYLARYSLGDAIQALWLAQAFTALLVTHDIDEAILLGDRVLIMDGGRLKDSIGVPLPRPRSRADLDSTAFAELRQSVLKRFEE